MYHTTQEKAFKDLVFNTYFRLRGMDMEKIFRGQVFGHPILLEQF